VILRTTFIVGFNDIIEFQSTFPLCLLASEYHFGNSKLNEQQKSYFEMKLRRHSITVFITEVAFLFHYAVST